MTKLVGLFGGSFDPIHHGHLIVAQAAAEKLGLTELRLVPARMQPFKGAGHAATAMQRAEMAEAAASGMGGFGVDRVELEREGPSYTVDTVRALRAREPGAEFIVLVGSDAAAGIPRWHEPAELGRLARIVAFGRGTTSVSEVPAGIECITVPVVEISATAIRERVRRGQSIRFLVPDAVADYVAIHGLYRDGAG